MVRDAPTVHVGLRPGVRGEDRDTLNRRVFMTWGGRVRIEGQPEPLVQLNRRVLRTVTH